MRLHVAMSKNINVARLRRCYVATLRGIGNRNTTTDTYDRGCIFSDIHGGMSLLKWIQNTEYSFLMSYHIGCREKEKNNFTIYNI